jgi:hypothetical protein
MKRQRRETIAPTTLAAPNSTERDRIRIDTRETIGMTIPDRFAAHREVLILIIHEISRSPEKDPSAKLNKYLTALESTPAIVASYGAEIQRSRAQLKGLFLRDRKERSEIIGSDEILKMMFFNLD